MLRKEIKQAYQELLDASAVGGVLPNPKLVIDSFKQLMDKNTPLDPIEIYNENLNSYKCPVCGIYIQKIWRVNYCYCCGQALKWYEERKEKQNDR